MKQVAVPAILVAVILFAVAVIADAQQSTKIPRIGILIPPSATYFSAQVEAFRQRNRT